MSKIIKCLMQRIEAYIQRRLPVPAFDAYLFGILIYEAFNAGEFRSSDQLASAKSIPQNVVQPYKRMIQPNPKIRLSVAQLLAQGMRKGGFFDTPLIYVAEFVENMGVKGETQREEFFKYAIHQSHKLPYAHVLYSLLEETGDQFPEGFLKMKVLPELLKAVEYGGGLS